MSECNPNKIHILFEARQVKGQEGAESKYHAMARGRSSSPKLQASLITAWVGAMPLMPETLPQPESKCVQANPGFGQWGKIGDTSRPFMPKNPEFLPNTAPADGA